METPERKIYVFVKDYERMGLKAGQRIKLYSIPPHLIGLIEELPSNEEKKERIKEAKQAPTEKSTKEEILKYLESKGVEGSKGTKADLLEIVKSLT